MQSRPVRDSRLPCSHLRLQETLATLSWKGDWGRCVLDSLPHVHTGQASFPDVWECLWLEPSCVEAIPMLCCLPQALKGTYFSPR